MPVRLLPDELRDREFSLRPGRVGVSPVISPELETA